MGEKKLDLSEKDRLWTFQDACSFLGLGKSAVYEMCARDEIPHFKLHGKLRFIPEQMWAWAKKQSAK